MAHPRSRMLFVHAAAVSVCALLAGCQALGIRLRSPFESTGEPGMGPGKMSATEVQSEVMSFTDTFIATIAQVWNQAGSLPSVDPNTAPPPGAPSPARVQRAAHERKLASVSAAVTIASNPNPMVALADIITLVTLQRMVLEDPATARLFGDKAAADLVLTHSEQEAKAWRIGERAFTPQQQQELVDLIAEWRREHPEQRYVAGVRLEDFARDRERGMPTTKGSGSLLSLIMLDPFAALDPASREMEKSRMLGERVFFYGTRMPSILKWQVESLYLDLAQAPDVQRLLTSMTEMSASASRISKALTDDREALLQDIEGSQDRIQATLEEFRTTVEATDALSRSVTATLQAADSLAARVMPSRTAGEPDDPQKNSLAEYRAAAAQTADTVDRLNTLVGRVNQLLTTPAASPQSSALSGTVSDIRANTQDMIDYAFVRLLILVVVTPFAIVGALALYRWGRLRTGQAVAVVPATPAPGADRTARDHPIGRNAGAAAERTRLESARAPRDTRPRGRET